MLAKAREEKKFPEESLSKAGTLLLKVREANGERIRRVFEDGRSTIVFVSRTADEAKLFKASTTTLFPNVDVIDYRLPAETHGLFEVAPTVKKYAKKFEDRAEAWRPLAQVIAATHPRARVIVQVERDYENEAGKQVGEDIVNKEAGRYALAHFAGANVQYLIPKKAGDAYGYLIRLQAAIYDLMFGHSGMAPVPAAAVAEAFPEEKDRPTAIVGFSVINLARRRRGGGAGAVAVATMVDVETGITKARVAWSGGASDWMEFGSALVYVAGLGDSKIGADREAAKETFQKFVSSTIAALVKSQVRPLVMFDATSASGLWPWLNNASLSGLPTFGREQISWKDVWEGLTLVRVRTQSSARLLTVMSHENLSVEPPEESNPDSYASMTNSTVKVVSGEGKGAYVTTHSWNRTRKVVRGTSVYRELPGFRRSKREKGAKQTFYEKIVHAHPSEIFERLTESPSRFPFEVGTLCPTSHRIRLAARTARCRGVLRPVTRDSEVPIRAPLYFGRSLREDETLGEEAL